MVLSKQCPDGQPRSPGVPKRTEPKVCQMSLATFERGFDRIAPLFLLALGVFAAISTAALGA